MLWAWIVGGLLWAMLIAYAVWSTYQDCKPRQRVPQSPLADEIDRWQEVAERTLHRHGYRKAS